MLGELDDKLTSSYDLVVVGGAAMILYFGARRATRDVDAITLKGDERVLRQAIRDVAQDHNLPENWVSDAVKGFVDILPRDFGRRLQPIPLPLKHLNLYALGLPEQVAMKVVALREQDLEDLELLWPRMNDADRKLLQEISDYLAVTRADWAQRIRYFMMERGWKIQ